MRVDKVKIRIEEKVDELDTLQQIIDDITSELGGAVAWGLVVELEISSESLANQFEAGKLNLIEFLDRSIHSHKHCIKKLNKLAKA